MGLRISEPIGQTNRDLDELGSDCEWEYDAETDEALLDDIEFERNVYPNAEFGGIEADEPANKKKRARTTKSSLLRCSAPHLVSADPQPVGVYPQPVEVDPHAVAVDPLQVAKHSVTITSNSNTIST
nr:hypothetical protein Iba_chr01aCG3800 [Ipomoea batatas]